jgi:hypothetical protein
MTAHVFLLGIYMFASFHDFSIELWNCSAALFVSDLEKSGTIVKVDNFMTVAKIGLMVLEENM